MCSWKKVNCIWIFRVNYISNILVTVGLPHCRSKSIVAKFAAAKVVPKTQRFLYILELIWGLNMMSDDLQKIYIFLHYFSVLLKSYFCFCWNSFVKNMVQSNLYWEKIPTTVYCYFIAALLQQMKNHCCFAVASQKCGKTTSL